MSDIDQLLQEFHKSLEGRSWRRQPNTPPHLFHYTNATGLLGILRTQRLWATNVMFLNDISETLYGRQLIEEIIDIAIREEERNAKCSAVIQFLSEARDQFYPDGWFDTKIVFSRGFDMKTGKPLGTQADTSDIYVACLCENPDLLSQWRGYGAAGGGYAVGLELRRFGPPRKPTPIYIAKIEYDPAKQKAVIGRIIFDFGETARRICSGVSQNITDYVIRELKAYLKGELSWCLLTFKNPSFAEEREWRFVFIQLRGMGEAPMLFRETGNLVIPYVELDLVPDSGPYANRLPISHIMCGPTHTPKLVARSLRMLLDKMHHEDVSIVHSNIPLRN